MDIKWILMGLIVIVLISGCNDIAPITSNNCYEACREAGYTSGSCEEVPVIQYPCGSLNKIQLVNDEQLCEPLDTDLIGVGVACCCDEGFCGSSSYGSCEVDSDCVESGCSSQICQSKDDEEVITTCEYLECYNNEKYYLECKCVEGECQWN